ncbi:MAG: GxxExxY protein [Bacteroidota bacterium]
MADNYLHSDITSQIIKAFFKVYNKLRYGFLEKVYQNALVIELRKMGLECIPNFPVRVYYDNYEVGFYISDIIVNKCVIVENKAAAALCEENEAQLVNYLKATEIEVGLLLNFGNKPSSKEKYFRMSSKIINNHNHHKNQRPLPNQPKLDYF